MKTAQTIFVLDPALPALTIRTKLMGLAALNLKCGSNLNYQSFIQIWNSILIVRTQLIPN